MQIMDGFAGVNDPARIAAQIITGIGFIGAGTVMRHGNNIYVLPLQPPFGCVLQSEWRAVQACF